MASLTVRQLDEKLKKQLRLRAARHGRSVEDEVRTILRGAAADSEAFVPVAGDKDKPERKPENDGRILLIIGGGIAAYKSLDLIRRLRERGMAVRVVMTDAAQKFITPLSVGALAGEHPFIELFDAKSEFDVGHIRLARDTDLVVVAPATADLMAKMANGLAGDLASAVLLATDRKILLAPAMNPLMWSNAATRRNMAQLAVDDVVFVGPNAGEMAESGEAGTGRMAEPLEIVAAAQALLAGSSGVLAGVRMLVTSGPTHEPIDPVRYIANRSSGKQGHAIAEAAAKAGANVTLVSGPVTIPDPRGVSIVKVESARDMLAAVEAALPADVAVFAAAVADWRTVTNNREKIKKTGKSTPELALVENPDILSTVAHRKTRRPKLVIGFAAETERVIEHAKAKLARKGCDWILANDVSPETEIMGGDSNTIHLVTPDGIEHWPPQSKNEVAAVLIQRIAAAMAEKKMKSVKVKIMRLPHGADLPLPAYQSADAAGLDLMAAVPADAPVTIAPGAWAQIPTGIAIALPRGTEGQVRPRSGLAARHGISVLNAPGTVDADYRGEIQVILVNLGRESFVVERGLRIAQLVIAPVFHAQLAEAKKLGTTKRGAKGFGSTGERTIDKKRKRRP